VLQIEHLKRHPESVMILDDDPFSTMLSELKLKKFLTKENILTFSDTINALEFLEKQIEKESAMIPDLILLEVMMNDAKGWSFIEQFDEIMVKFRNYSIQLIILTSSQFFSDYRRALQYSAVKGFMIKPMQEKKLLNIFASTNKAHQPEVRF
jgi:response regulator of citrate/malate metabolism